MSHDHENEFRSALESAVTNLGLDPLTEEQSARLAKHYTMLLRWNKRINLTRITGPEDAARLHYGESLFGSRFIISERKILDIGSGAGFPAIPLAVLRPELQVTALEANQKKSIFLKEAKDELMLTNLRVVTARMEEFDWASYELLASRAIDRAEAILPSVVASLNAGQRLMLFCTHEMVIKLEQQIHEKRSFEKHPIPLSDKRLIAIFMKSDL